MVSDSKRFQTLAFPEKGTMTAGASCGASSAADASDLPGLMSTIDSLIGPAQTLAKAFKDAKDAKDAKK
jgi:hypothetical protein